MIFQLTIYLIFKFYFNNFTFTIPIFQILIMIYLLWIILILASALYLEVGYIFGYAILSYTLIFGTASIITGIVNKKFGSSKVKSIALLIGLFFLVFAVILAFSTERVEIAAVDALLVLSMYIFALTLLYNKTRALYIVISLITLCYFIYSSILYHKTGGDFYEIASRFLLVVIYLGTYYLLKFLAEFLSLKEEKTLYSL
mmetsp:Transcript_9897/g.9743  ORF Transcript_9897/g.9743 Transcript_9897/m.9743 type:complete len:200 (-) Transcript_9897:549-1148(-)